MLLRLSKQVKELDDTLKSERNEHCKITETRFNEMLELMTVAFVGSPDESRYHVQVRVAVALLKHLYHNMTTAY